MQLEIRKIILIGLLAFISITLFQQWTIFQQEYQAAKAPQVGENGELIDEEIPLTPEQTVDAIGVDELPQTDANASVEGEKVKIKTDLIIAEIDVNGGDITRLDLIKHPVSVDLPDQPFQLLKTGTSDVFTAQTGLIGKQDREYPNHKTTFTADQTEYELEPGENELTVKLKWTSPDNVIYHKVFTFKRNSYNINIDFEVQNNSPTDWQGYLYAQFQRSNVTTEQFGLFGSPTYKGGVIFEPNEKYQKIDFGEIEDNELNVVTDTGWVGMIQHYFVGAWIPEGQGPYQFYGKSINRGGQPLYNIGYKSTAPIIVPSQASGELKTKAYIGTKEQDRLNAQGVDGLILTVDYGWLTIIASPMFKAMNWIYQYVQNWGFTIVIITILLKLLFFPLSAASYKSMAKMKKFQPRLMTLRERYGDDRQKLNMEMMKLYKQEKINPMGGCLPILIQIPVFIALYWVLLESVELRQAPFIAWIKDLSLKDPFYVLPVLYGASMYVMQKLNPAPIDPIQQRVMQALPIVFTFLFLWFPAGLVLYWLVNNLLSMAQQWYITKKYA